MGVGGGGGRHHTGTRALVSTALGRGVGKEHKTLCVADDMKHGGVQGCKENSRPPETKSRANTSNSAALENAHHLTSGFAR